MLALFNFAGALAMAVAPAVTGYIDEAKGNFDLSFFMAGAFSLLALASFTAAVRMFEKGVGELSDSTEN